MRHALALLLISVLFVGCDSLTTATADEPQSAADIAALLGAEARRPMPVCVPSANDTFVQVHVPREELTSEIEQGAVLPNTGGLNHQCVMMTQIVTCPCFDATDLTAGYDGHAPQPYLHFDTFNWYGLDFRRTEVRAVLDVDGGTAEQVASVYITPGLQNEPVLICHRQSVEQHPVTGEAEFVYVTEEPTVAEAEACRRTLTAFAGPLECQGPACGTPYSSDQLDPNYPEYDLTRPAPTNDAIQRIIARAQAMVTRVE